MELLALTVIGTVLGSIVAVEASAWMPHLSRRILRSALSRLPADLPPEVRTRWIEEIQADFACFADRPVGGLVFALGVRRKGARRLAAELKPRRLPARVQGKGRIATATDTLPRYRWVPSYKSFGPYPSWPRYVRIRVGEAEEAEGDD